MICLNPPPPFYFLISKIVKLQLNKYSKPRYSKLCCIVFKMHELSCPKMNLWKWCNLFVGHFKRVWSEKKLSHGSESIRNVKTDHALTSPSSLCPVRFFGYHRSCSMLNTPHRHPALHLFTLTKASTLYVLSIKY